MAKMKWVVTDVKSKIKKHVNRKKRMLTCKKPEGPSYLHAALNSVYKYGCNKYKHISECDSPKPTVPINKTSMSEQVNIVSKNATGQAQPSINSPRPISKRKLQKASLRERMLNKLQAARFRYLNEQLYLADGNKAYELFNNDPESFEAYHVGFKQQVNEWPINPVDEIIKSLKPRCKNNMVIADFGCGNAKIAESLDSATVHSFDLKSLNDRVTVCDMSHTPLEDESVDIAVFCLSLMGTNLSDYIKEANRVLRIGGSLKIAEVESRFENVKRFIQDVEKCGFKLKSKDFSHNLFYFFEFDKLNKIQKQRLKRIPNITLRPCLYKKR